MTQEVYDAKLAKLEAEIKAQELAFAEKKNIAMVIMFAIVGVLFIGITVYCLMRVLKQQRPNMLKANESELKEYTDVKNTESTT